MPAYAVCRKPTCATLIEGKVEVCPKCGSPVKVVGEISPWRGYVLLSCGLLLVLGMGVITLNMLPTLTNPGVTTPGGTTYNGTAEQAQIILLLFTTVILFGLIATANGVYMLVKKRQSRTFMFVSLGAAAVLVLVVFIASKQLKDAEPDESRRTYRTY